MKKRNRTKKVIPDGVSFDQCVASDKLCQSSSGPYLLAVVGDDVSVESATASLDGSSGQIPSPPAAPSPSKKRGRPLRL